MKKLFLTLLLLVGAVNAALADWTGKDASGSTVTFSNPGTCTSVVCVPVAQLVNASGATLLGTAGTANAGVLTVQGIASMTALLANPGTAGNWGIGATGSAVPANAQLSGGSDGTNTRAFATDSNGQQKALGGTVTSTALQSGATANGNGTNLTVTNYSTALVNVSCSVACSGGTTINFEGTDSTGTFFSVAGYPIGGGASSTTATTNGQFLVPVTGLTSLRARISAYSAGTITVTGTPFYGPFPAVSTATGGTSSSFGSSFPASGTALGLTNGTNMVAWSATTNYGTSPGAIAVPSVNAFVTNQNANGSTTSSASAPVVIASDQAAVATKAASGAFASGSLASGAMVDVTNFTGSTGSAPPSKAAYLGANQSGATGGQMKGLISCDSHMFAHITTATDTLAVQGVASQTIYVCSWRARAAGVATWFLENTASTNANCASAKTQLTGVATEAANTGETWGTNFWSGLKNTSGNGLCINSTGTGGVDVDIWYTQF